MPAPDPILVQWSICPAHLSFQNSLDAVGLRRAMDWAVAFWEPVTRGLVEFQECPWRERPRVNHIELHVGEVDRSEDRRRIAQNTEFPNARHLSRIKLARDRTWKTAWWEWFRDHDARHVMAHELGHNLDIPHIRSTPGKPGLRELMTIHGWILPGHAERDWTMASAIPLLGKRMEPAEANAYRAYFINHPNHLWKGDLKP